MIYQANERTGLWILCKFYRACGYRIVFTNGCFDILHEGHIRCLHQASKHGTILVVGVNGDASVRRLKGNGRPVFTARERAFLLSRIRCVDHVAIFNEDTPEDLIRVVRPHVLVKGSDWKYRPIAGSNLVEEVKFIPYLDGHSTTEIVARMRGGGA